MRHATPLRLTLGLLVLAGPALAQPMGKQGGDDDRDREMQRDRMSEQRERMGDQRGRDPRDYRGQRHADRRDAQDAREFLREAQDAVRAGRFGRANEYLERAATRILSRSIEPSRAREPMANRTLGHISEAREALNRRDPRRAVRQIERAIESIEG